MNNNFRRLTVLKCGAKTGVTRGSIKLDGIQVKNHDVRFSKNGKPFTSDAHFQIIEGQYEISSNSESTFIGAGDSGASVYVKGRFGELYCIGIAIGYTSYGSAIVTPIFPILKKFGLNTRYLKKFPEPESSEEESEEENDENEEEESSDDMEPAFTIDVTIKKKPRPKSKTKGKPKTSLTKRLSDSKSSRNTTPKSSIGRGDRSQRSSIRSSDKTAKSPSLGTEQSTAKSSLRGSGYAQSSTKSLARSTDHTPTSSKTELASRSDKSPGRSAGQTPQSTKSSTTKADSSRSVATCDEEQNTKSPKTQRREAEQSSKSANPSGQGTESDKSVARSESLPKNTEPPSHDGGQTRKSKKDTELISNTAKVQRSVTDPTISKTKAKGRGEEGSSKSSTLKTESKNAKYSRSGTDPTIINKKSSVQDDEQSSKSPKRGTEQTARSAHPSERKTEHVSGNAKSPNRTPTSVKSTGTERASRSAKPLGRGTDNAPSTAWSSGSGTTNAPSSGKSAVSETQTTGSNAEPTGQASVGSDKSNVFSSHPAARATTSPGRSRKISTGSNKSVHIKENTFVKTTGSGDKDEKNYKIAKSSEIENTRVSDSNKAAKRGMKQSLSADSSTIGGILPPRSIESSERDVNEARGKQASSESQRPREKSVILKDRENASDFKEDKHYTDKEISLKSKGSDQGSIQTKTSASSQKTGILKSAKVSTKHQDNPQTDGSEDASKKKELELENI